MKKTIILSTLAVTTLACQMVPEFENPSPSEKVTIYFSSEKPASESETKTYYSEAEKGVLWSPSGEYLSVAISNNAHKVKDNDLVGGGAVPDLVNVLSSNEGTVSADGKTATFSVSMDEKFAGSLSDGEYRFHAVYPASASFGLGNMSIWDWGVFVGTRYDERGQYPPEGTFDPQCDVMLAISKSDYQNITSEMNVDLIFERLVTHGKITLKGLTPSTSINKAIIKVPAYCTMTGVYYINVIDKNLSEDKANRNYTILNYITDSEGGKKSTKAVASGRPVNEDGTFDLWFCTKAVEIQPGDKLTVTLYTADGIIERSITANSNGIKFEQNKLSTLSINMSEQSLTGYYCEILETPHGTALTSLPLPRTGGKKTFYLKTNAGNSVNFDISACQSVYSITPTSDAILQEDGTYLIEYVITHRPNWSISKTVEDTVPISIRIYGDEIYNTTLKFSQECGRGEIVNETEGWTADPVVIGGYRWYPVNLGFSLTQPYGKYYQFGRYAGQYAYCDDNSTKYEVPIYDGNFLFKGTPDDDTFYGNTYWWYSKDTPPSTYFTEDWIQNDSALDKGKGNPCPAGWRLPTREECQILIDNASSKFKRPRTSHMGASFAGKSAEGTGLVWEIWDAAGEKFLEFPIGGYINTTIEVHYVTEYRAMTSEEFQAISYADMKREVTSDYAYGMYWISDTNYGEPSTLRFCSRGNSNDVSVVDYVYPGNGCSVRCIQKVQSE